MGFGQCQICRAAEARYKCPKCYVVYCSLVCFKSPEHKHDAEEKSHESANQDQRKPKVEPSQNPEQMKQESNSNELLAKIADDPTIKSLLAFKSLRAHLSVLLKLLLDSSITNEPISENRKEIANMRLCELRIGGAEENELVEEFVQRVLQLQQEFMQS